MKKSLSHLLKKLDNPSNHGGLSDQENDIEFISNDEAVSVRGGDKEYKPIYEDDPEDYKLNRASIFFDLF